MIVLCWQAWRSIIDVSTVAANKDCHDVWLRKQHLGYHNNWNCWYFILLYGFGYCTLWMLAVLSDGRWKLHATYCITNKCHHFGMML